MHWKDRQMFGGKPNGIVQMMGGGMTPYPSHTMPDGTVMRGAVHGQGYEIGGMVGTELFEEGDNDVNSALNMMASASNPEVPEMPASNGMSLGGGEMGGGEMGGGEMTMDQGSGDYPTSVRLLKNVFQDEIRDYVMQVKNPTEIQNYITNLNRVFTVKVKELKNKFNVTEEVPEEILIDEMFREELSNMISMETPEELPNMAEGGLVDSITTEEDLKTYNIPISLAVWLNYSRAQKQKALNIFAVEAIGKDAAKGTTIDRTALTRLMEERRANAKQLGKAARSSYKSISSRPSQHYADALSTGDLTEATAMNKILGDEISQERQLLSNLASSNRSTTGGVNLTSGQRDSLSGLSPDEEIYDPQKAFDSALKNQVAIEILEDKSNAAIIDMADQGQIPPSPALRKKKILLGKNVSWIQYYNTGKKDFKSKPGTPGYYADRIKLITDFLALPNAI
tara:strand:+ start:55 stop:1413 length:1359 start_codon:yes stop_codon:yes gene_type:complete